MGRGLFRGAIAALVATIAIATPVLAHGDHDAQPLGRGLTSGPFTISLWQLSVDNGTVVTPHVIVMFDNGTSTRATAVTVAVNSQPMDARPSATTPNGWETMQGVTEGEQLAVTVSDGSTTWAFDPVVVPPPPGSGLPIKEVVIASMLLTLRVIWWVVARTARVWRNPAGRPIAQPAVYVRGTSEI
jgi:hypothetical protein